MPDLTARITEILHRDPFTRYPLHLEQAVQELAQTVERHYRSRIETVEQLDALPDDSVVRDDSRYVYEKATSRRWHQPGWEGHRWSDEIDLPAVVLWSPGADE